MTDDARRWVEQLELEPHPEGGYYRETYRASMSLPEVALPKRFDGDRDAAALIYFLVPASTFSALHRIRQDEMWHFYAGDPLTLHEIAPDGTYRTQCLGRDPASGHQLHTVVSSGSWFGATVDAETGYALVGCTTAPAFDFEDFELADRDDLATTFPEHRDVIERLTRN